MTITRAELIQKLVEMQNHPINHHIDILTITGFMNDHEVLRHAVNIKNAIYKSEEKAA